jgi:hypothetical protein
MMTESNMYPSSTYEKSPPGAVSAQSVTTVFTEQKQKNSFQKALAGLSIISWILFGIGDILLLTVGALAIRSFSFYYNSIVIVSIVAFSFWFIQSVIQCGSYAGIFNKDTRNGYQTANFFGNTLFMASAALLVVGSALIVADGSRTLERAGYICWVSGACVLLFYFCLRALTAYMDAMTARVYLTNYEASKVDKHEVGMLCANGLASIIYVVSSTLFLLGSVLFLIGFDQGSFTTLLGNDKLFTGGILWTISGSMFLVGSIVSCIARR